MTYLNYGPKQMADILASTEDLTRVQLALVREKASRDLMAQTGEGRGPVTEMVDAAASMDEEAVLDLMDGEPTTLADAVHRYVEEMQDWDELLPRDQILSELSAILDFPWP